MKNTVLKIKLLMRMVSEIDANLLAANEIGHSLIALVIELDPDGNNIDLEGRKTPAAQTSLFELIHLHNDKYDFPYNANSDIDWEYVKRVRLAARGFIGLHTEINMSDNYQMIRTTPGQDRAFGEILKMETGNIHNI